MATERNTSDTGQRQTTKRDKASRAAASSRRNNDENVEEPSSPQILTRKDVLVSLGYRSDRLPQPTGKVAKTEKVWKMPVVPSATTTRTRRETEDSQNSMELESSSDAHNYSHEEVLTALRPANWKENEDSQESVEFLDTSKDHSFSREDVLASLGYRSAYKRRATTPLIGHKSDLCRRCGKKVYPMERIDIGDLYHRGCFKCQV